LAALLDPVPPIARPLGRPRPRPAQLDADQGDAAAHGRAAGRQRGRAPRSARRGSDSRERLGRHRWVAARACAWLSRLRRLRVRDARRAAIQLAFLQLGCALIGLNFWLARL